MGGGALCYLILVVINSTQNQLCQILKIYSAISAIYRFLFKLYSQYQLNHLKLPAVSAVPASSVNLKPGRPTRSAANTNKNSYSKQTSCPRQLDQLFHLDQLYIPTQIAIPTRSASPSVPAIQTKTAVPSQMKIAPQHAQKIYKCQ